MKAWTNIEQSKKLVEILPPESADMYWWPTSIRYYIDTNEDNDFNEDEGHIRAWSLAALLSTLPSGKALIHDKEGRGYKCICNNIDTCFYDNPVDACVEMILKLHKLNIKSIKMKTCTDIEQSRKLAKILPIDSADMYWWNNIEEKRYETSLMDYEFISDTDIPAWSLTALANLLPTHLFEFDKGIDLNIYPNLNRKGWHVAYMPNNKVDFEKDSFRLISNGETLVDALYDMIIKLHEKNLIK